MKNIPGLLGLYSITEDGKIWSNVKGKFLVTNNNIYERITLTIHKKVFSFKVHRLVALTYLPNPDNKRCINHKNGIKTDNRLENIEWCTHSENMAHSYRKLGRKHSPKLMEFIHNNVKTLHISRRKKVMQLTKEGILCKIYDSVKKAGVQTNIWNTSISQCALGKSKSAGGFEWRYIS